LTYCFDSRFVKNNSSAVTTALQNDVTGFVPAVQPNGSNPTGNTPQAFLTILFFDERFNFIAAADGGLAQQQIASSVTADGSTLSRANIPAPKNGYAYAYVSNQSNQDVFFDNFKVQVVTGNIIEENHYYAYGLKIAAISSKKLPDTYEGVIKNNYLYNDKELFEDGDLNWYDYGFRNYDPQTGRFVQMDPLTDYYSFFSPYLYAANEPIGNIDFMGMGPETGLTAATAKVIGEVVVKAAARTATAVATTANVLSRVISISTTIIQTSISVANIINSSITTTQVGDRALIVARGSADAILNANTVGLTDFFGSTSNLDDYSDPDDQAAYLEGRLLGDAFVMAQSAAEISGGLKVGGSLALTSGGTSAIAGGVVIVHGVAIRAVAINDAAWATAKLLKLNASAKTSSSSSSTPTNGETNATKVGRDAHKNYNPGSNYTVDRRTNRLDNGKIPDAIDVKNRTIRELKPNNYRAIRYGREQLKKYIRQLEKQYKGTKGKWKSVIDTYEVQPDGTVKYNYNNTK